MNSLFRNSVFNFLSQIIIFLSAFAVSIFLARLLGPEQMGEYSFWMWVVGTGALLFTLGIPRSLMRFIAQHRAESKSTVTQIISRTLIYQSKILLLFLTAAILIILIFGGEQKITYLIIACTLVIMVLNSILGSALSGLQKYNLLLKVNLLISPLTFLLTLIILLFYRNLNNLLLINLTVLLISFGYSFYFLKDYFKFDSSIIPSKIYYEIKKYTTSLSLIVFLDLILMERSEIFFLKNFSTLEQIAFYSIGFGLVSRVMTLIPGAVSGVILPKIAWLHGKQDLENIKITYKISSRYLILIVLPIIFAGVILIDLPVKIFYGIGYEPLVPVIQILLISGGLSAIVAAAAAVLFGIGKQSFILKLAAITAGVNIFLDFLLIPSQGALGAAFANAIAQILGVIAGTYYMVWVNKMPFPWTDGLKILLASLTAGLVTYFVKLSLSNIHFLLILLILSGFYIILYIVVLVLLKVFNKQDFEILERLRKRIK